MADLAPFPIHEPLQLSSTDWSQKLATAIILQAFQEAINRGSYGGKYESQIQEEARYFLLYSSDFDFWCTVLDVDTKRVRKAIELCLNGRKKEGRS